jgi:hypothetical protein
MPVLECFYVVFIRHRGKVHYGSIEGFIHHTVRVRGVIVCKRNNTLTTWGATIQGPWGATIQGPATATLPGGAATTTTEL